MPVGYWCPVLHAHLPYVRHPEYPEFLEEDWFFEALTETYVPLVDVMDGLLGEIGGAGGGLARSGHHSNERAGDRFVVEPHAAHEGTMRCAIDALRGDTRSKCARCFRGRRCVRQRAPDGFARVPEERLPAFRNGQAQ